METLCDPQPVLSLSAPLFLQQPVLGPSFMLPGPERCRALGAAACSPPPPLYGRARRLGVIVWVTGATGAAGAPVGPLSLENRALLFLAQVTCKRYSSLTHRYRCCHCLLAGKEAGKGLPGAFGRGLGPGRPCPSRDAAENGLLGGRAWPRWPCGCGFRPGPSLALLKAGTFSGGPALPCTELHCVPPTLLRLCYLVKIIL